MTNPFFLALNTMLVFFGEYDTMWNAWMSMGILPPDVKSWNKIRNPGEAAYGVKIENTETNYEEWYNVREPAA